MTTNLFTTVCAAPPHTQLQALKRSVLALAVIGFGSTTLASVKAAQYQTAITGSETGYEAIRSEGGSGLVYTFSEGDSIVLSNSDRAIYANDNHLTIRNKVGISNSNEDSQVVVYSRALYAYTDGIIETDDLTIESSSVNATDNGWAVAFGLDTVGGSISTKNITANVSATGAPGSEVANLQAQGFRGSSNGSILIDGNANFTLSTQNIDSYGLSENSNIAGAVLQSGSSQSQNLTITGCFTVNGSTILTSSSSDATALAAGIAVYDTGTVNVGSLSVDLSSIVTGENASAEAVGILSSDVGLQTIQSGDSDIHVSAEAKQGGDAHSLGIASYVGATIKVGAGVIEANAVSDSGSPGSAGAYGILANGGSLSKGAGNITVESSGTSFGIWAGSNGVVNYDGGTVTVTGYDETYAAGICVNTGATVNLNGNTEVNAGFALLGAGTVVVQENTISSFNGYTHEYTGDAVILGKAALGMSSAQASTYSDASDAASLTIWAGSVLNGRYTVGTQAQVGSGSGSSLDLLSDGTLIIAAGSDYDGSSALVTVDSATAQSGSVLRLVNAARVQNGTTVFNVVDESTAPDAYIFETDNLLTEVLDNKIVKKSAESVFGSDLIMPNTVNEAMNGASGEGIERIIALTSDSLKPDAASNALNRIALMSAAGGAQIAASHAVGMIDDSIMRHGSKLAALGHESLGADLWVDLSGSFSRAHDFKAGSASYGFKSDLAGGTVGADWNFSSGVAVGAALSFGTGSVRGQNAASGTKNDVDYWGVNFYGVWDAGLVNMIGSIGWLQTNNDISQDGRNAAPDVSAFTMSARLEKTFALGAGYAATPHIGVRWAHINMDDFVSGGFSYENETVDLISFPIGVAFTNTFTAGTAELKPFLDMEIAPTAGDKHTDNRIGLVGGAVEDVIDTRIASSVVYSAKIGLSGNVGIAHNFGLYYGVSAGNGEYVSQQLKAAYRFIF